MGRPRHAILDKGMIEYHVLQKHFNMPIAEAARKFDVSLTLFKQVCRQNGIQRWPHRKLRCAPTDLSNTLCLSGLSFWPVLSGHS